jgi:hypothetical protein
MALSHAVKIFNIHILFISTVIVLNGALKTVPILISILKIVWLGTALLIDLGCTSLRTRFIKAPVARLQRAEEIISGGSLGGERAGGRKRLSNATGGELGFAPATRSGGDAISAF